VIAEYKRFRHVTAEFFGFPNFNYFGTLLPKLRVFGTWLPKHHRSKIGGILEFLGVKE
jgi:hypothetical protein